MPNDDDRKAWEKYGPAIFHSDMTGPEVIAAIRLAERARIMAWIRSGTGPYDEGYGEKIADAIEVGDV
jgi:uncharacterized OB-fold protein